MIELKKSQEAIKGLAKLIIQEPRLTLELNLIRKNLKDKNLLSDKTNNEKYLDNQLEIISKAEEIANKSLLYVFQLYDNFEGEGKGFMLYKRVDNKMVALQEDFERGFDSKIKDTSNLLEIIKGKRIKHIITYDPFDVETVYSQMYEIEGHEDENTSINHAYQHMSLDQNILKLLENERISVTKFNEEQIHEFEKDLKFVYPND